MFRYTLFVLLIVVVFLSEKRLAAGECQTDLDCRQRSQDTLYCCKTSFHPWAPHECFSSCAGKACDSDSDCGGTGGECCNTVNGNCTTKNSCLKKCYSNSDCTKGSYCCKGVYFNPSVCASSCVGKTCSINSDCGAPNECCSSGGECIKVGCDGRPLPVWLIAVIVIVAVLLLVGFVIIIYFWCFAGSSSSRREPLLNRSSGPTNFV